MANRPVVLRRVEHLHRAAFPAVHSEAAPRPSIAVVLLAVAIWALSASIVIGGVIVAFLHFPSTVVIAGLLVVVGGLGVVADRWGDRKGPD